MMNINMTVKNPTTGVKYIPFQPMVSEYEQKTLFLAESIMEEVMRGSEKQQHKGIKKLKKILKISLAALGTGVGTTTRALAAVPTALPGAPVAATSITPAIVMKWGLTIALISVSAGIALSMIMLSVAGMYRMFRKREKATEWTNDIIKGLVQVLIAVPTVLLLFYLAQILFQHLSVLKAIF
jgi:hypothetical protein